MSPCPLMLHWRRNVTIVNLVRQFCQTQAGGRGHASCMGESSRLMVPSSSCRTSPGRKANWRCCLRSAPTVAACNPDAPRQQR